MNTAIRALRKKEKGHIQTKKVDDISLSPS